MIVATIGFTKKSAEEFFALLAQGDVRTLVGSAPGVNVAKLQPKTYGRASGLSVDSTSTRLWAIS